MWELFTLFCFMEPDLAAERVVLAQPVAGAQAYADAVDRLEAFRLADARCYNPNEEARLREVIGAVGEERFHSKLRQITQRLRRGENVARGGRSQGGYAAVAFAAVLLWRRRRLAELDR